MIICRRRISAVVALTSLAVAAACDGGSPSRTPDEFAADSALAADLALANRDTLLVDSIGAYSPLDSANHAALDSADAADSVIVRDAAPVAVPRELLRRRAPCDSARACGFTSGGTEPNATPVWNARM